MTPIVPSIVSCTQATAQMLVEADLPTQNFRMIRTFIPICNVVARIVAPKMIGLHPIICECDLILKKDLASGS